MELKSNRRTGASSLAILFVLVVIVALGWVIGKPYWSDGSSIGNVDAIMHEVARDDFTLTVTERGELQSAGVTEIKSEIKAKNATGVAIMRIVPEGTDVKEGDFLVELDATALKSERTSQRIMCNSAEAIVIESENVHQTAVIAKREYLEGTYVEARQTIESEVFVAEENLNRAREYHVYSQKLATKGYVTDLQLEADKFAVEKSTKELEAAKTKLKVLDEFTRAKMVKQLESDILIASAKWEANKNSYQLELKKLEDIEEQIAKCTIVAPKAGTVMYAHVRNRRGDGDFIVEEGVVIRERQAILKIPESNSLQVEIKINESLIQYVEVGMPATISPVGMGDVVLQGVVDSVNRYAEPSGWRKANVKDYKAFIKVVDAPEELRSGLTASVTIECSYVPDTIKVPVQAVYAHGKKHFCLVYDGKQWDAQEVTCGPTNDKFFVIENGLDVADNIALNPRKFLTEVELPELPPEDKQRGGPDKPATLDVMAKERKTTEISLQIADADEAPQQETLELATLQPKPDCKTECQKDSQENDEEIAENCKSKQDCIKARFKTPLPFGERLGEGLNHQGTLPSPSPSLQGRGTFETNSSEVQPTS